METQEKTKQEKSNKKRTTAIVALLLLIIVLLLVLLLKSCGNTDDVIVPDYPPQGTQSNQKPLEGDNSDKVQSGENGGSVSIYYTPNATASLSKGTLSLTYANPNASNQNVSILIMVDDLVVAKTELITPDHGVDSLTLEDEAKERLQPGGYDAMLVIRSYDPETGEKAMVDTQGELTLTVYE